MAVETSTLSEVIQLISQGTTKTHCYWYGEFVLAGGERIAPLKILNLHTLRDYVNKFGDEISLSVLLPMGTYISKLYPARRNLLFKLYRLPVVEDTGYADLKKAVELKEYRVFFKDENNRAIEADRTDLTNSGVADLTGLEQFEFQLVDQVVEQAKLFYVSANMRDCTAADVLVAILTKETAKVRVEASIAPLGVTLAPPNNSEVRKHVIIPPDVRLVDLPKYLQKKAGGIYSAGIGNYYQNRHWFVYPPFNLAAFNNSKSSLTIANVPEKELTGIERSYRQVGNSLFIIATGSVKQTDPSARLQGNDGHGVRYLKGSKVMDGYSTVSNNKAVVDRSTAFNEYVSENALDKMPNVPSIKPTDNTCYQLSLLAARKGAYVQLLWEHSEPDLIKPGMPMKMFYTDNSVIKTLYGVVHATETSSNLDGTVATGRRHITNTAITCFVTRTEID